MVLPEEKLNLTALLAPVLATLYANFWRMIFKYCKRGAVKEHLIKWFLPFVTCHDNAMKI